LQLPTHLARIFVHAGIAARRNGIGKKAGFSRAGEPAIAVAILTPRVSCAANAAMNG
jgi:hypothetical protein